MGFVNTLYYGDNLDILQRYVEDNTVDLIYLDPPFNSKATYNVLFDQRDGSRSAAQIKAFEDTWQWDVSSARTYEDIVEKGGDVSKALQAFRGLLGESNLLAYLVMMAPRLLELRRVLKPTGSLYLHCDPTASHYLKILMDPIFGAENFVNEIIWSYKRWPVKGKFFQRMHDVLFLYQKDDNPDRTFNTQYVERAASTKKRWGQQKIKARHDETGARIPSVSEEKASRGVPMRDVWSISIIAPSAHERLGYPTQKPEALLDRIIKTSSKPGDVVLDPFCGCGTTIASAVKLRRRWIGIDITHLAITLIKHRLQDSYGEEAEYKVVGEPVSLNSAKALAKEDRFQFEIWALGLVGARPDKAKKGADRGIDGVLYFHDDNTGKTKKIIISVKSGKVKINFVRQLQAVVTRESAQIGVLIILEEPTRTMPSEAASSGFYNSPWGTKHPRTQILTIEQLLKGKRIDYPATTRANVTYKRAPRHKPEANTISFLDEGGDIDTN